MEPRINHIMCEVLCENNFLFQLLFFLSTEFITDGYMKTTFLKRHYRGRYSIMNSLNDLATIICKNSFNFKFVNIILHICSFVLIYCVHIRYNHSVNNHFTNELYNIQSYISITIYAYNLT